MMDSNQLSTTVSQRFGMRIYAKDFDLMCSLLLLNFGTKQIF